MGYLVGKPGNPPLPKFQWVFPVFIGESRRLLGSTSIVPLQYNFKLRICSQKITQFDYKMSNIAEFPSQPNQTVTRSLNTSNNLYDTCVTCRKARLAPVVPASMSPASGSPLKTTRWPPDGVRPRNASRAHSEKRNSGSHAVCHTFLQIHFLQRNLRQSLIH